MTWHKLPDDLPDPLISPLGAGWTATFTLAAPTTLDLFEGIRAVLDRQLVGTDPGQFAWRLTDLTIADQTERSLLDPTVVTKTGVEATVRASIGPTPRRATASPAARSIAVLLPFVTFGGLLAGAASLAKGRRRC